MNRVIYQNLDKSVSIFVPSDAALKSIDLRDIAETVVPQDLPYWFVDAADIPIDRTHRDAWEIDETMGEPDGFGGESNEFTDEQLLAFRRADNV